MAKAIMKNNKIYEEVMSFLNTGKRKKQQGRETVQGLRDILFTASALRGLNEHRTGCSAVREKSLNAEIKKNKKIRVTIQIKENMITREKSYNSFLL